MGRSLLSVAMRDIRIGQIVFDKNGQLFAITRLEPALPGNIWPMNRKSDYDAIGLVNPDGYIRTVVKWIHRTGFSEFDELFILDIVLDRFGIQSLLANLQAIQSSP
jgi:hypothetical protein